MTPTRAARVASLRSMTGFGRAQVSAGPVALSGPDRAAAGLGVAVTVRGEFGELVALRTGEGWARGAALGKLAGALRERTAWGGALVPAAVARGEVWLRERIRALLGEAPIDQARVLG